MAQIKTNLQYGVTGSLQTASYSSLDATKLSGNLPANAARFSGGKINNAWKRFRTEWTQKLMDDETFTDPIPSNQADFVNLVTARDDYKDRTARDAG
jgi:hypothetical protein|tara:strand:+ start:201 stop:491 length:291 start_codon:yes stop_codon:yes gene_type:complete